MTQMPQNNDNQWVITVIVALITSVGTWLASKTNSAANLSKATNDNAIQLFNQYKELNSQLQKKVDGLEQKLEKLEAEYKKEITYYHQEIEKLEDEIEDLKTENEELRIENTELKGGN